MQHRAKRRFGLIARGPFWPGGADQQYLRYRMAPRSGRRQSFPEVDRADWFDIEFARTKMLSAQVELLDRLLAIAA